MAEVPAVASMPVPEKLVDAPAIAPPKKKPPSSPMPVPEKPVDAPATASAKKKPPRKRKGPPDLAPAAEAPVVKRKGKGPPNLGPATEAPVAKKPRTGDGRTSAAEPPRSGVAVAAATHIAVQTLPSASSVAFATLRYGLPAPRSTLPVLHDVDADGRTPQQFWGKNSVILFTGWPRASGGMYALALVAVFALAFLLEFLGSRGLDALLPAADAAGKRRRVAAARAAVHAVRVGVAYLLMLALMSFNGGVFLVAVAGHAVGFLVFKAGLFGDRLAQVEGGGGKEHAIC